MRQRFDWRAFGTIALAALIGAAWAGYNLWSVGGRRDDAVLHPLIWTVFATPFATCIGWALIRSRERWLAATVCFTIYFFAILAAARIERLVLGEQAAAGTHHALYFRLCLAFDLLACLAVSLHRALHIGTIPMSTGPEHRAAPSRD